MTTTQEVKLQEQRALIAQLEQQYETASIERSKAYKRIVFESIDHSIDLPYQALKNPLIGARFPLPTKRGSVHTRRIHDEENGVVAYMTDFHNDAILKKHYHSDCIEVLIPIEGIFTVTTEKGTYHIEPGQSAVFSINEIHLVGCLGSGLAKVLFSEHPINHSIYEVA